MCCCWLYYALLYVVSDPFGPLSGQQWSHCSGVVIILEPLEPTRTTRDGATERTYVEGFKGIPPPAASSTSFPLSQSFFVLDPSSSDDYIMRLSTFFFFFFPLSALSLSAGREVSKWLAKGPLKATGENLCLARRQGTYTEQHRGGLRLLHFATPPRKRRCACVSSCFSYGSPSSSHLIPGARVYSVI